MLLHPPALAKLSGRLHPPTRSCIISSRSSSALAPSLNGAELLGSPASFTALSRACRYGATSAAKCAANARIEELQAQIGSEEHQPQGGFLDSMRDALRSLSK